MAYIQKTTALKSSGVASSSNYGIKASTVSFNGFLYHVEYVPDGSNPLTTGSSGVLLLRVGSTTGKVIFRSSSALSNSRVSYFPRARAHASTYTTGANNIDAKIPLANELVYLIRHASSTGSTQAAGVNIYIEGSILG
jgi:hypothetical protein